jgi:purine-nucleoside phosphorylase
MQGKFTEALANFREGESLFRQLGDRHMINAMQSEQAHIERKLGHYSESMALYSKTLSGWQELGHAPALAHELECFAFIAGAQSQPQRAVRLLGGADTLRECFNSPMRATERSEYDQNVSALREQLGAQAFAESWAEGRDMTVEQAVAYAQSDYPI